MDDNTSQGLLQHGQHRTSSESLRDSNDSSRNSDTANLLTSNLLTSEQKVECSYLPFCGKCSLLFRRWVRSRLYVKVLTIAGIILALSIACSAFIHRNIKLANPEEPTYGLSPPWYPSPRGGTTNSWSKSYEKAARIVRNMTLAEKVNITTGTGWQMGLAVGNTGPAVHVGFPGLSLQDGPLGIRMADNATALPAGVTVGATWSKSLMYRHGQVHGAEARLKGLNVLLGPCVGPIGRLPAGGRNWEGFGADPYLQGIAGALGVRGIQSEGVMATIKHFAANEQEHFRQPWEWGLRHALSANVDDRTLHELYIWPFADAVHAGVASVMCSYNMVNNSYACSNSKLLNGILKDELGFQGFVMSDWLAQRSGVASALAGLDMTMPGDGLKWQDGKSLWGSELTRAVLNGSVPIERLNDMATRIVAAWYQLGQDKNMAYRHGMPNFSSWTNDETGLLSPGSPSPQELVRVNEYVNVQNDHSKVARSIAVEGTVLLKNTDGCLPLNVDGSMSNGTRHIKVDRKVKIGVFGEDAGPNKGGPNACKDRGCNDGTLGSGWGSGAVEFPYLVTPIEVLSQLFDPDKVELGIHLSNKPVSVDDGNDLADLDICLVFANSDAGESFLSWNGINGDRNDLNLQKGGDALIRSVASGCGNGQGDVIVVIHAVGPVLLESWIDLPNVMAVLHAHLPGQESGYALADILFGRESPSGKLPYTIGRSIEDYGSGAQVLYQPNTMIPQQNLSRDGLYIDYRYFDKFESTASTVTSEPSTNHTPRFEFGFGLSYTSFSVSNLTVLSRHQKTALPAPRLPPATMPPKYDGVLPDKNDALFPPTTQLRRLRKYIYPYLDSVSNIVYSPLSYPYPDGYYDIQPPSDAGGNDGGNPDLWETYVTVSASVHNTGARDGKAVVQLYLVYPDNASDSAGVDFPVKVLRGFEKVSLGVGATESVSFNLSRRDLSYWDIQKQNWVMVTSGEYSFLVGQSSRNLPLIGTW